MLALWAAFAVAIIGLAVWLLTQGLPLGAVLVVAVGVLVRRSAESGLIRRFASRFAHPS
jgi:hypothetical protein